MSFFRIGIISDTHGLLRPEAERRLAGVDHIVHGGDIGRPEIIDALRRIAPVTAVRGNVDTGGWAREFAIRRDRSCARHRRLSGHSHVPKIDTVGGVLYLNPGSAGRRRFSSPITLATLDVTPDGLRPAIHDLG